MTSDIVQTSRRRRPYNYRRRFAEGRRDAVRPARVRRVATTLAVLVATLAVVVYVVSLQFGDTAVAAGRTLYGHRILLELLEKARQGPRPSIAWLGDSTIMDVPGQQSYPTVVYRKELVPRRLSSVKFAMPGLDLFADYALMGEVLDLHPNVVVLIADLRACPRVGGVPGFSDLAALIPEDELPRAAVLPIAARGLTIPRLLLARALRTDLGAWTFLASEGIRRQFQDAPFWASWGPGSDRAFLLAHRLVAYDPGLTPRHPQVRFAGAAVRMASERGVRALVLVTPMPWEFLQSQGRYDRPSVQAQIDVLGREIEANGGVLLDLHEAMTGDGFRDRGGHFNESGTDRMEALVWPALVSQLDAAGWGSHPVR
jgi:hypothetical protein